MPANKNHHYVPQFYLRGFSGDKKTIALMHLASAVTRHGASIAGQSCRGYLYGKDGAMEARLRELEEMAAPIIRRVVELEQLPQSDEEHAILLEFVTLQYGRTPALAASMNGFLRKFHSTATAVDASMPPAMQEYFGRLGFHAETPLSAVPQVLPLAPYLLQLQPVLLVNRTSVEFVSSDAPVVFYNKWAEAASDRATCGFASIGLMVLLPFGPRALLMLYDKDIYQVGRGGVVMRVHDEQDVQELNGLQLLVAENCLYFSGDKKTEASLTRLVQHRDRYLKEAADAEILNGPDSSDTVFDEIIRVFHRRPSVDLKFSKLRLTPAARRVPAARRSGFRPAIGEGH